MSNKLVRTNIKHKFLVFYLHLVHQWINADFTQLPLRPIGDDDAAAQLPVRHADAAAA